jgi:hypothetical protein
MQSRWITRESNFLFCLSIAGNTTSMKSSRFGTKPKPIARLKDVYVVIMVIDSVPSSKFQVPSENQALST